MLAILGACGPGAPAAPAVPTAAQDAAATAIASAPTVAAGAQVAIGNAQTVVAVAQTALPGAQATVVAGATVAATVLNNPQLQGQVLGVMLGGATVAVQTTPSDATGDAVQQATVVATDVSGTFARLDSSTQRQSASAALLAAGQMFPKATVTLSVKDSSGKQLLSGMKAPGSNPTVSQ